MSNTTRLSVDIPTSTKEQMEIEASRLHLKGMIKKSTLRDYILWLWASRKTQFIDNQQDSQ